MKRLAVILMLSMSVVLASDEPAEGRPVAPSAAPVQERKTEDSSVGWRTMVVAAALILSPLFAGWALVRAKSRR